MKKRKSILLGIFLMFCLLQLGIVSMADSGAVKIGNKHYYYSGNQIFVRTASGDSGRYCFSTNNLGNLEDLYACDGYLIMNISGKGIYRISTDGKRVKKLANGRCFGVSGKYIIYDVNTESIYNSINYIKRVNVNGGGKRTIKKSRDVLEGYWVDGKYVYYLAEKDKWNREGVFALYRCTLDGKNVKYIMPQANDSLHPMFVKGTYGYYLEWKAKQNSNNLRKRNIKTGKKETIVKNAGTPCTDGKYIYYIKAYYSKNKDVFCEENIYKYSIKTGKTACIVKMKELWNVSIVGSKLYFTQYVRTGVKKLYTCNKDGKNLRFLKYVYDI